MERSHTQAVATNRGRLIRNTPLAVVRAAAGIAAFGFAAIIGMGASHDEPVAAVGVAIVLTCAGVYCLLWARTGVIVDDTGVTIRSIIR